MKTIHSFLVLSLVLLFAFNSCKKYDEDPSMTLLSAKARITGDWKYEKMISGTTEINLDLLKNTTIQINKDGTGLIKTVFGSITVNRDLEWEFGSKKDTFRSREKDDAGNWSAWEEDKILRLTKTELWLLTIENNNEVEVRFKKK